MDYEGRRLNLGTYKDVHEAAMAHNYGCAMLTAAGALTGPVHTNLLPDTTQEQRAAVLYEVGPRTH
jgi:hypothetical protein